MNGELAILDILLSDATVTGIVEQKVFLYEVPQGVQVPYIVIEDDDSDPHDSDGGASAIDYGRIRVFPYHDNQTNLITLATAIREAIEGKAAGTYKTVNFDYARFINQSGFKEEIENREAYAKDQEYEVRVIR